MDEPNFRVEICKNPEQKPKKYSGRRDFLHPYRSEQQSKYIQATSGWSHTRIQRLDGTRRIAGEKKNIEM